MKEKIMSRVLRIEQERNIKLPGTYKLFYDNCDYSIPPSLLGTDLRNDQPELNEWANELLNEDGVMIFLNPDDFVFMMHQGYIFWYFKADGSEDPIVFGYYQGKLEPDNLGPFSKFIRKFYP